MLQRHLACTVALCSIVLYACGESRAPAQSAASGASATRSCQGVPSSGEPRDLNLAQCLADPAHQENRPAQRAQPRVVLYLDRSASMQGFLDPGYPGRTDTDFRSVIDRLIVGTTPEEAYSYGVSVRPFSPTLGVVGNKAFYSDRDTRVEDVLAIIARDTIPSRTYVLVGDGRRGSPNAANGQFTQMRDLATKWIAAGGSFLIGATMAPFKTVDSDPSGCRLDTAVQPQDQTCPLYTFIFVAPQDVQSMTGTVAEVFQNVFAWPAPIVPGSMETVTSAPATPQILVQPHWASATDGTPIVRVRSMKAASNREMPVHLEIKDTTSFQGRAFAQLLAGENTGIAVLAKSLAPVSLGQTWSSVSPRGGLIQLSSASQDVSFITRGSDSPRSILAVDLVATGYPRWLGAFDATDAADIVRTYGLGHLFEEFRLAAQRTPALVARYFFVAN